MKLKKELDEIKTLEEDIDRKDLIYETNKCTFNFQLFETIRSFIESICNGELH